MSASNSLIFVIGFVIAVIAFVCVVFLANMLLSPRNPNAAKNSPFECGIEQAGEPWAVSRMRFSVVAILFVVFDAEAVLLFAVADRLRGSVFAVLEVGVFVACLAIGLAYAWRKGALEWR